MKPPKNKGLASSEVDEMVRLVNLAKFANGSKIITVQMRVSATHKLQLLNLSHAFGKPQSQILLELLEKEAKKNGF